jgi:hypothetical protein
VFVSAGVLPVFNVTLCQRVSAGWMISVNVGPVCGVICAAAPVEATTNRALFVVNRGRVMLTVTGPVQLVDVSTPARVFPSQPSVDQSGLQDCALAGTATPAVKDSLHVSAPMAIVTATFVARFGKNPSGNPLTSCDGSIVIASGPGQAGSVGSANEARGTNRINAKRASAPTRIAAAR